MTLYRISSGFFTAGIVVNNFGRIIRAAPVVRWMVGRQFDDVQQYFKERGWTLEKVAPEKRSGGGP